MSAKKAFTTLLLSLALTGCQWAYEQENIFDGHLSTQTERDNKSIERGESPMKRPTYDEYRESIDDKKMDKDSILP